MQLTTQVRDTIFHAKISQRLAFSDHTEFRQMLMQVTQSGSKSCVLDLSELESIDSSGLGMFIVAHEESKKNGWSLTLAGATGQVKTLIQLGKFDKILPLQDM